MPSDHRNSANRHTDHVKRDLISSAAQRLAHVPGRWLLVDVAHQRLLLILGDDVERSYPVSSASRGLDATEGSGGTPPGVHIIGRKIGGGMAPGTLFQSRRPTGRVWRREETTTDDLILSRILTLAGQEHGVNQGPGVDSLARYIYIHGTNHEEQIGQPASHGCIRLTNSDVIDLFDRVEEGDPVVIV